MRDFSKVSPTLWHSDRFNGLPADDVRYTYLYLLTSEHQTSAGCHRLPDAYAAADLRWPIDRYQKARAELEEAELIHFDATASVLMIRGWFQYNPPMNEKHLKGIRHILERLPSQSIWAEATAELDDALANAAKVKVQRETQETSGDRAGKDWSKWKPRAA